MFADSSDATFHIIQQSQAHAHQCFDYDVYIKLNVRLMVVVLPARRRKTEIENLTLNYVCAGRPTSVNLIVIVLSLHFGHVS